jgi:hypothetical protein
MASQQEHKTGSLNIVGTGIQVNVQTTLQARECIEQADKVFYAVANRATGYWIRTLNPNAEPLEHFYQEGKDRLITYREIVEHLLTNVRAGLNVCGAFYGHPGIFAYPSHEAIRRARLEGYPARMLPGISAEDCLFADLAGDPALGMFGYQCFEATDFLIHRRRFDPHSALILWQIGVIANPTHERHYEVRGLDVLADVLSEHYPHHHQIVVYEAAQYPICEPMIKQMALRDLPQACVTAVSTLYIPRLGPSAPDAEMMARLGLTN